MCNLERQRNNRHNRHEMHSTTASREISNTKFGPIYEGCSLILVIDSFSPKSSSVPEEKYLVVIDRFFGY